jgi:hypothetical protein
VQPQPHFQPEVMERFAALLERRARSFVRGFTGAGVAFGAAVGALPLTPVGDIWPVPHVFGFSTLAVGAAAGGLVGYATSKHRAGMLRLQAQSTLCQLHTQRTSFALWLMLKSRGEDAPAAADAPASEPVRTVAAEADGAVAPEPARIVVPPPASVPVPPAAGFALAAVHVEPPLPPAPLVAAQPEVQPPVTQATPPLEPPFSATTPPLGSPFLLPAVSRAQSHEPAPADAHPQTPAPPLSPAPFAD